MADNFETRGLSAMGATFSERKAAREAAEAEAQGKQVRSDDAEDKAVRSSETKAKRARKKS